MRKEGEERASYITLKHETKFTNNKVDKKLKVRFFFDHTQIHFQVYIYI